MVDHTKTPYFDSRSDAQQWEKKDRPIRQELVEEEDNVLNEPLLNRELYVLPPAYISSIDWWTHF